MCALRLERPRQPVLERPHPARRTQVMSPARHTRRVGQSDNVLLGPPRTVDDRDQNAAWTDEPAKRFARRLDETMDDDPIEALPRTVMFETVRPNHRDIGESEGLDPCRRFHGQRLETFKRHDRVSKLGQQRGAIACSGSYFADAVPGLKLE